jgi:hypothetical protein
MIDVDDTLRSELEQLVPRDSRRDWAQIASAAGLKRERARRWAFVAAASLAAAGVLAVSTPLGSALVRGLDDFSAWLSGEPGSPASETDQREFDEANARSWLRFPEGTRLRELASFRSGAFRVTLFGFRSGSSSLCLRLRVTGDVPSTLMSCAPLDELRRSGGPARPVIVDHGVGKGDKVAWYGIDRIHSTDLQITAGIAADGVRAVVVEDESGKHEVTVSSNAFLYVAEAPEVGQRVKRLWAAVDEALVPVPFAPAPFGPGGMLAAARTGPVPPNIERKVEGGRIRWLEHREPRGESLDVLPADFRAFGAGPRLQRHPDVLFGRVLTPDADRPARLVATLNANKPGGRPEGLCTWVVTRRGGAGGCAPYPEVFERRAFTESFSADGSRAFVTVNGIASDHAARIEALLADGQRAEVPLKDNAFIVDLPRANLPALLVAYDEDDKVIDLSRSLSDFGNGPGPARGRAESLLRVAGAGGATAELFVGPSTDGGQCFYVKDYVDERHGGVGVHCVGRVWTGPLLQIGTAWRPPRFVKGRVHPDVKSVRIHFADGPTTTVVPTRGYILWAVPEGRFPVEAEGLGEKGSVLEEQHLGPPKRATRSRRSSSPR